jgi:hypothetical protein
MRIVSINFAALADLEQQMTEKGATGTFDYLLTKLDQLAFDEDLMPEPRTILGSLTGLLADRGVIELADLDEEEMEDEDPSDL